MSHHPRQLTRGDQIHEFRILSLIEADEICHVYHAVDTLLDVPVCLKEFHPVRYIDSRDATFNLHALDEKVMQSELAKFMLLNKQLARIKSVSSEKLLRYFSYGQTGYIVSEYYEGQSLQKTLVSKSRFTESELIELFTPLLQSLQKYHDDDIVHADLTPSRIRLRSYHAPLLTGFCGDQVSLLTPSNYSAPEVVDEDQRVSTLADIYSLGALLYSCISGLPPLPAKQRLNAIKKGLPDPQSLAAKLDGIAASSRLLTVIDHCLDLRPERRPDSAALILDAFRESSGVRIEGSLSVKTKAQELKQRDPVHVTQLGVSEHQNVSKIIVTGTSGTGKTSMIEKLCDEVFTSKSHEETTHLARQREHGHTIDQGCIYLPEGDKLYLYGLPGPLGFETSWDLVRTSAIGIILLLDNSRKDPQRDLSLFLSSFDEHSCPPIVIGITRTDISRTPSIRDFNSTVDLYADRFLQRPAVFTTDSDDPKQACFMIEALLTMHATHEQLALQPAL